jgi:energy-converting hydrogenase Eha subunit A
MKLDELLMKYIGDSPVMYLILGLIAMIVINLILTIIIAARSKEVNFELMPDFITPTLTYTIFLLTIQILVFTTNGTPGVHEIFIGFQSLGYAGILVKYFAQIYSKLKKLGMPADTGIERQIESLDGAIIPIPVPQEDPNASRPKEDES